MTIDLHVARTSSDRVFELLDALASLGPGPHRLRDVAARARLGASTTHRILQAAIRAGMVSKPQRGRYFLSATASAPSSGPSSVMSSTVSSTAYSVVSESAVPARPPLAVSRRIRLGLAALQKATEQPVLLYVPLILDTPMRYCMAYFAPAQDELLSDAERLLASDMVFCAPLTVDAPGRLILAHMSPERSSDRARAYVYGPSPVAGWNTLAAPLRRYGQIAGVICVTARASWMGRYSEHALQRLLGLARELGDELPTGEVRQ